MFRALRRHACAALPTAAIRLAEDAAQTLQRAVAAKDAGVRLLDEAGAQAEWLAGLEGEAFRESLPLLRRVFARDGKPERRAIGEALCGGGPDKGGAVTQLDGGRAMRVVPVVLRLPGVGQ
ncbi:hypothetical protein DESA109040_22730 [Deinococcus saxicola]|uniref:DUF5682 family protein n=1 Tax=Deinococcus saxicola TaxID=249406 RepID=UPI0039F0B3B8